MDEQLTEANFLLYCAKNYDGRHCSSTEDFYTDINRIRYIKKLLTRYERNNDLKERLILNHIIILNNVFGPAVTCRILYLKLKKKFHLIKPFLVMLNILPERLFNINNEKIIDTNLITMDQAIINRLRKI